MEGRGRSPQEGKRDGETAAICAADDAAAYSGDPRDDYSDQLGHVRRPRDYTPALVSRDITARGLR